jgi:dipeptidyl aminopeptidase/acylaminoacyl peptidase
MEQASDPNKIKPHEELSFSENNVKTALEQVGGVSNVKKIELDTNYFETIKEMLAPEVYETIKANYEAIDVHSYQYLSDGLSIAGFMWSPKEIKEQLPITVWNRGGTQEMGSIADKEGRRGPLYLHIPAELAKQGSIVVASEYRGGFGSEGKDEWGGKDLDDVIQIKKIADQLPMSKPGKAIVAGFSRGGMMSYLLAVKEPWVKGVISISGTADLLMSAKERPEMQEVFEECFGGSDEEKKKRSATYFYEEIPKELPMLIMHSVRDDRVSIEQVRKLRDLLETSKHTIEYHEFTGGGHAFNSIGSQYYKESLVIIENFVNSLSK